MKLETIILDEGVRKSAYILRKLARKLMKLLDQKGTIEVYLIDSRRMRNLNKLFRKKNVSTNVLSFQKPKNFPGKELGEVYLDPVYIAAHKEDFALMLVHGVLHILGYDHETKSDRIKMEYKEAQLLKRIRSQVSGIKD